MILRNDRGQIRIWDVHFTTSMICAATFACPALFTLSSRPWTDTSMKLRKVLGYTPIPEDKDNQGEQCQHLSHPDIAVPMAEEGRISIDKKDIL